MHQTLNTTGRTSRIFALLSLAALAASAGRVCAIEPIGDNSELFITGTGIISYNDNIFLNNGEGHDDVIFDEIPGLSYEFGKVDSLTTGQLAAYEDFEQFGSHSKLNNELFNGVFSTKYDDGKTKLNLDASMHQLDQAALGIQNVNMLVDRNEYHADALGEEDLTEKTSFGAGIVWDDTAFKTLGYTDWRYVQIPLNFYYKYEPKLDWSGGIQFQDNTVGAGFPDSTDVFYNIGARGEFTPNLTGTLQIGYDQIHLDNGLSPLGVESPASEHSGLGVASTFTYSYSPKTTATLGVNDNYGYGATNGAFRNFGVYVGMNSAITEQWSVNGQIGYNHYSYLAYALQENYYTIRGGINYTLSTNVTLSGTYAFQENNANLSTYTFKQNVFMASATIHF